ncbi:hypothetical protein [Nocardia sp. NPDC024068]|uniref:hypothetical protein n=1 Tax=Nocardia sp. NPDC024068 TaxID=3157197 RepID=UPI0033C3B38B
MRYPAHSHTLLSGRIRILAAAAVLFAAGAAPIAAPAAGPARADPEIPVVALNDYCAEPGAVGQAESDGRTVYCTAVVGSESHVWSYSQVALARDPNTRGYTCGEDGCRYPDGAEVPGYQRCGLLCGEPPTSGDVQSGVADCFESGVSYDECLVRVPE